MLTVIFWAFRMLGVMVLLVMRTFVALVGKKRMLRMAARFLTDQRTTDFFISIGQAGALMMFQAKFAEARMRAETQLPEPAGETDSSELPAVRILDYADWPECLDDPPSAHTIAATAAALSEAGRDRMENWRIAVSEAFRTSGALLYVTAGCEQWAKEAKAHGLPEDVVKVSFAGGMALSAFQIGLICGQYTEEPEDSPEYIEGARIAMEDARGAS
jgi:hypothetical protein